MRFLSRWLVWIFSFFFLFFVLFSLFLFLFLFFWECNQRVDILMLRWIRAWRIVVLLIWMRTVLRIIWIAYVACKHIKLDVVLRNLNSSKGWDAYQEYIFVWKTVSLFIIMKTQSNVLVVYSLVTSLVVVCTCFSSSMKCIIYFRSSNIVGPLQMHVLQG